MTWCLVSRLCENRDTVEGLLQRGLLKRLTQAVGSSGEGLGPCVDTLINVGQCVNNQDSLVLWSKYLI